MKRIAATFCLLTAGTFCYAQQAPPPMAPPADPARVFITDSNSWSMSSAAAGGGNGHGGGFGGSSSGGARPQTAEIIKTFGQRCPQVIVNNKPEMVDYIVELDHEGGKSIFAHKDKVAVFVRTNGDSVFSESTLSVGGSVQDSCKAILAHWGANAPALKAAAIAAATPPPPPPATPIIVQTGAPAAAAPGVSVEASVPNCDIEVDGDFVGSTPSVVTLTPGKHAIVVKKKGFEDWTRSITFSGGTVRLNADMTAK